MIETGPCPDGRVRDCTVDLGTYNGVHSCFTGQQRCYCGEWGPCVDPELLDGGAGGACGGNGGAAGAGEAGGAGGAG
jgi:hypothetical protein